MSYIITKQHIKTETIEIEQIKKGLMPFKTLNAVRKEITGCSLCDTPFKPDDKPNLAFVKNAKNILICDSCTDKAFENGAEKIDW